MKLVIDIDEDLYKAIRDCAEPQILSHIAIKNGTPLPKGHGRLIDVDDMLRRIKNFIDVPDKYISQRNKDFVYCLEREEVIIQADKDGEEGGNHHDALR